MILIGYDKVEEKMDVFEVNSKSWGRCIGYCDFGKEGNKAVEDIARKCIWWADADKAIEVMRRSADKLLSLGGAHEEIVKRKRWEEMKDGIKGKLSMDI